MLAGVGFAIIKVYSAVYGFCSIAPLVSFPPPLTCSVYHEHLVSSHTHKSWCFWCLNGAQGYCLLQLFGVSLHL